MKIQYINPYVFRIEEYLPQEVFQYLEDYCRTCQFSLISNKKDFFCSIQKIWKHNNPSDFDQMYEVLKDSIEKLKWVSERIFSTNLFINPMFWLMKLQKNNFMWIHRDLHSTVQWVFHFQDIEEHQGWALYLEGLKNNEFKIFPRKNSIVVFHSSTAHRIWEYFWDVPRYSMQISMSSKESYESHIKLLQDEQLYEKIERRVLFEQDNSIKL